MRTLKIMDDKAINWTSQACRDTDSLFNLQSLRSEDEILSIAVDHCPRLKML